MSFSLLTDGFFSDVVDDAGRRDDHAIPSAGRAHRDGLVRGLAVMGVAAALFGLTLLSAPLHSAAADTRCKVSTGSAANEVQAAIWWEAAAPFFRPNDGLRPLYASAQSGTAVSLIALRQRFHSACR